MNKNNNISFILITNKEQYITNNYKIYINPTLKELNELPEMIDNSNRKFKIKVDYEVNNNIKDFLEELEVMYLVDIIYK